MSIKQLKRSLFKVIFFILASPAIFWIAILYASSGKKKQKIVDDLMAYILRSIKEFFRLEKEKRKNKQQETI